MLTDDDYRAVFDASPDGCLVVGSDGTIRGANARVTDLFGWTPDELVGKPIEALVPDDVRGNHESQRTGFVSDPRTRPMGVGLDLQAQRKDGSTFPVEISLSPWSQEGRSLRIICTVRDVSDYRRLRNFSEGALRASEEERERISRELHDDIAQRLATLILSVRRVADESEPEARHAFGEKVREEIVAASEAVRLMARGLRPPELEEVGLALAIRAYTRRVREATGFEVETDLEPVGEKLDLTERLAIYRIVQEALSNAKRHGDAGGARVRFYSTEDAIVAEVEDSGTGFAAPFERGSGLGLLGMQERATMIGARLTIDSEPGRGTLVRVAIPNKAPDNDA